MKGQTIFFVKNEDKIEDFLTGGFLQNPYATRFFEISILLHDFEINIFLL